MGDLFHFVELPDEQMILLLGKSSILWKLVGDNLISIEAARNLKPTIRDAYDSNTGLVAPAQKLNKQFEGLLFGLCGLLLNAASSQISILNAGSMPPLLRRIDGSVEKLDSDLPLGILEDYQYKSADIQLAEDEVIVVCTEGLVEAKHAYNISKLEEQLQLPFTSAAEFLREVMQELHKGYDENQYQYDATLICIRRKAWS